MCDTFCIQQPGRTVFAKSSDRPIDEAQVLRWFPRRPPSPTSLTTTHTAVPDAGAAALLGSQPVWMWGLEHGVNEHGVAIGNEKVFTVDDPRDAPPALLGMDLVRLGLERGTTAAGALDVMVDLLETHGQGGSGEAERDEPYWSSFLVADAREGWVLETSGRSWVARPVDGGTAISNRLTLATDWTRSSADIAPGDDWQTRRDPAVPTGIADHRLAATRQCVARGPDATAADAVAALRDHGSGPWGATGTSSTSTPVPPPAEIGDDWSGVTVCMHARDYQCTTASMVGVLPDVEGGPLRVWASLGTPCTGVFLPVRMATGDPTGEVGLAVVPGVLGQPDTWARFAALSRRVEAPGDEGAEALVAVRSALGPIEDQAWSEADDLVAGGDDPGRWQAAAGRWSAAVDHGLTELGV